MNCDPKDLMLKAIDKAREGIAAGRTPFGCAIARDGEILSVAHNTVWQSIDITAHAEINALREACARTGDIDLTGAVVATTCEPCPMCLTALHWARVDTVYHGATIADAAAAGFNEMEISAAEIVARTGSHLRLVGGLLEEECRELFQEWLRREDHRAY